MQRREAVVARQEKRRAKSLYETDYLLGVHDSFRMGALRFRTSPNGPFLDDNHELAAPTITSLPELQHAANKIEETPDLDNPDYLKWLNMLISPGSSLGGARPKASIRNHDDSLWLAKFLAVTMITILAYGSSLFIKWLLNLGSKWLNQKLRLLANIIFFNKKIRPYQNRKATTLQFSDDSTRVL
ncbi:hypothetical protein IC611_02305 [Proteus mirabilis]